MTGLQKMNWASLLRTLVQLNQYAAILIRRLRMNRDIKYKSATQETMSKEQKLVTKDFFDTIFIINKTTSQWERD